MADGIAIAWEGSDPHVIAGCGGYDGPGAAETICVHGDTPGAVAILRACRKALFA